MMLLNIKKFLLPNREIFPPQVGNYRETGAQTGSYFSAETSTEISLLHFLA